MRNRIAIASPGSALSAARASGLLLSATLVVVFACLTAVGALIRVPLPSTPVPLTLQTFFVLLAGGLLGARRGLLSQAFYLSLGAIGLPVFAAGSVALLGPTGGYLIGFAVASLVVGCLTAGARGCSLTWTTVAMSLGLAAIYLLGTIRLALFTPVGLREAISMGVLPFLLGDVAKLAAAVGIVVTVRRRLAR